jgi:hypothetical protein
MGYEKIDSIIESWATARKLPLYRMYKEEEIRAFELASLSGKRFQIWVSVPNPDGTIPVHVWDFKKRRRDFLVSASDLFDYLENAYRIAIGWGAAH